MIDTLVIVIMLVSPVDTVKHQPHKYDLARLRQACHAAAVQATEATKEERDKVLNFDDIRAIVEELKRNSVKPK